MKVDVKKCERCGQAHDQLSFIELVGPAIIGGETYPYVGQCPVTYERIFLKVAKTEPRRR